MQSALLVAALALASGQTSGQPYAGSWIAEHKGTTFVRLELRMTNGALAGEISLGDIQVDAEGVVHTAADAPSRLTALFDVVLGASALSFARKDGNDIDHFELRLVGDRAELRFIPSEADRQELAANGVPVPKPIPLTRVAR